MAIGTTGGSFFVGSGLGLFYRSPGAASFRIAYIFDSPTTYKKLFHDPTVSSASGSLSDRLITPQRNWFYLPGMVPEALYAQIGGHPGLWHLVQRAGNLDLGLTEFHRFLVQEALLEPGVQELLKVALRQNLDGRKVHPLFKAGLEATGLLVEEGERAGMGKVGQLRPALLPFLEKNWGSG